MGWRTGAQVSGYKYKGRLTHDLSHENAPAELFKRQILQIHLHILTYLFFLRLSSIVSIHVGRNAKMPVVVQPYNPSCPSSDIINTANSESVDSSAQDTERSAPRFHIEIIVLRHQASVFGCDLN